MKYLERNIDGHSGSNNAKSWPLEAVESEYSDNLLKQCFDTLAMTGHELRNPIAAMRGALSVISDIDFDAPACEILPRFTLAMQTIERQLDIQTRLASDLQDLTIFERGELGLRRVPLDLLDLMTHTVNDLRPRAESAGLRLELTLADTPVWVSGDAVRIAQLIGNLLGNSFKFTPRGGCVGIDMRKQAESITIRVVDSGIGIDPALLTSVFKLFTQCSDPAGDSYDGLGLGLHLSKRIVLSHEGTITIKSAGLNQGTMVSVSLPIIDEPDIGSSCPKAPTLLSRVIEPNIQSLRILLVEDNADLAAAMEMLLTRRGHEILVCDAGQLALSRVNSFRPQIVLLDIGLPDMDGFELARQLRQLPATAAALYVALTGQGSVQVQPSLDAEFDYHLVKPCSLAEIDTLLDACCQSISIRCP